MESQNAVLETMGYPLITQEEHDDVIATLSALGDPESLTDSVMADEPGTTDDQVPNVFYLKFNPSTDTQTPELKAQLEAVKANVDLSNLFFSTKANQAVKEKVSSKQLKDEEIPKKNYTAKVINHLAVNAPWTAGFAIKTMESDFVLDKNKFHADLVKKFSAGLALPDSIKSQLEPLLTRIRETIKSALDPSKTKDQTKDGLFIFILITLYHKDEVLQAWQPYVRTIYFRVNAVLSSYALDKDAKKALAKDPNNANSGTNATLKIEYAQQDGAFNDALFKSHAKEGIQALLGSATKDFVKMTTIEVDV